MGTLGWIGAPEADIKVNVGRTQGSAFIQLLFIAVVALICRKICTKDILRKLLYACDLAVVADGKQISKNS